MPDFGPTGGPGGTTFDDVAPAGSKIGLLIVRHGGNHRCIIGIQAAYVNIATGGLIFGDLHGADTTGTTDFVALGAGEFVTEISGRSGQFLDSLSITTSTGRHFGRFGGLGGGADYEFPDTGPSQEIFGFFGRSGTLIDALGVHTRPRT